MVQPNPTNPRQQVVRWPIAHYQRISVLPGDLANITKDAELIPDNIVSETLAIGGIQGLEEK
jgi:hypothetical protein